MQRNRVGRVHDRRTHSQLRARTHAHLKHTGSWGFWLPSTPDDDDDDDGVVVRCRIARHVLSSVRASCVQWVASYWPPSPTHKHCCTDTTSAHKHTQQTHFQSSSKMAGLLIFASFFFFLLAAAQGSRIAFTELRRNYRVPHALFEQLYREGVVFHKHTGGDTQTGNERHGNG